MRTLPPTLAVLLLPSLASAADFAPARAVFDTYCVSCHGPARQRASLRLDSATTTLAGGESGKVVVPGRSADSLLVKMIRGHDGVKVMPPKQPRPSSEEIARVVAWIDGGAKVPAGEKVVAGKSESHWAFKPVVRRDPPAVKDADWVRTPIDRFVLARLESLGVRPSPEADRATLIRRLSLDLTGIPPTPEAVRAFVADARPDAYERLVERLLASPAYGERWGRHWLDQARYADSNGYSIDSARTIWKYRDWVIAAINADLPFSDFTTHQLAGDMLPRPTQDSRIATGFHRNTQVNEEGGIDKEQFRVEAVVDRTNTTGSVWLGLTVGCAQCHDHKYDPISQKEYYRLFAFFNNSDDPKLDLLSQEVAKARAAATRRIEGLEASLKTIDGLTEETLEKWEGGLSADDRKKFPAKIRTIFALPPNGRTARQKLDLWAAYRAADRVRFVAAGLAGPMASAANLYLYAEGVRVEKAIAAGRKSLPTASTTLVVNERRTPRQTRIMMGGDFTRPGAAVTAGVPAVLPSMKGDNPRRLELANWLVDGKNPLVGRVLVNRLWQQYFGLGLVETDNDFGTQGSAPSHPELLDWLASEVVRKGWSLKDMHRLVVSSAVYRQSSKARPDLLTLDARNLLLARQNRLRLEAEGVRDVSLAASGLLTPTVGGPSVFPPQPEGVYGLTQVPKNWTPSVGPDRYRRGMYTYFWRSAPHPGLTVFDAPDATAACTRRNRSNTPLQALTMLNDEAALECARAFAARITAAARDDEGRIVFAFETALGRVPSDRERAVLASLLERQRKTMTDAEAWAQAARVVMNLDEFITRE